MTTPSLDSVPPLPPISFPLEIAVRRWLQAEQDLDEAMRDGKNYDLCVFVRNCRLQRLIDLGKPRIYGV